MRPDKFFEEMNMNSREIVIREATTLQGMSVLAAERVYGINFQYIYLDKEKIKVHEPHPNIRLKPGMRCKVWGEYRELQRIGNIIDMDDLEGENWKMNA